MKNMIVRWFLSKAVRQAVDFRRRVRQIVNEQRDLLSPDAVQEIEASLQQLSEALRSGASNAELQKRMDHVEKVAHRWLKPYAAPGVRENVKEVVVAIAIILSFTTFFLQLTKIPTGSLQPTLFGITYYDLRAEPNFQIPGQLRRIYDYWVKGISYFDIVAKDDGALQLIDESPRTVFPFVKKQSFTLGPTRQTVWFPPDDLFAKAGARSGEYFRRGQTIVRMKVVAGDHLLVDRFSYNFRRPRRGEIFVFKTKGIEDLGNQDLLYIKRLVGLPGERVQIGDDQHLIIEGRRLDASTPRFENVYSFDPKQPPRENHYFGHVNGTVAARLGIPQLPTRFFPDENTVHVVAPGHYLAMGDNTLHSYDSRGWGDVPQENITGKAWFVYWPITERFGWGTR